MWNRLGKLPWWGLALLAAIGPMALLAGMTWLKSGESHAEPLSARSSGESTPGASATRVARVEVAEPQRGGIERVSIQPGTVIAFESAQLFAKISGYLKYQPVDIGSKVGCGDVLAEIDAPELFKEVDRAKAAVDEQIAAVAQAEARVLSAQASREAAVAAVKQAEAEVDRATATRVFREKQYQRIKDLYDLKSIDARLVDEKLEEMDAARASESAARAAVVTDQAQVSASTAKVEEAKSDVINARAQVEVAKAALAKAQVYVEYTRIISPYDGVVTKRNFFRGDFIRAADQGGTLPLLAVDKTGVMRVVVQVPDRDVPFTNPGDAAEVEIDALPGQTFPGKVARIADAEDPDTRTMRTEIDLPNEKGRLRQGMYGKVTIHLEYSPGVLSIPTSSVVGSSDSATVYVVKKGVAHAQSVKLGPDNGLRIEVLAGLSADDQVIERPGRSLSDGTPVEIIGTRD